jgi:hypothetical protein
MNAASVAPAKAAQRSSIWNHAIAADPSLLWPDGMQRGRVHGLAVGDFRLVLQACLVVLLNRVARLDAAGLEGGKKAFQVIDSVLNLNRTQQAASSLFASIELFSA